MQTKEKISGASYYDYSIDSLNKPLDSTLVQQGWIRRPTDRLFTLGMFIQDYLSTNKNFKVYLNLIYGSNLPYSVPGSVKYRDALVIEPYIRADLGFSALLLDNDKSNRRSHNPFRKLDNIWATLEIFNVIDRENTISYLFVKDFSNVTYAMPQRLTPRLINLTTQLPFLRGIAKFVAGVPRGRSIPAFAPQTFRHWFNRRQPHNVEGSPVLLWPDTFNNYFLPDTAKAAVEILESAGYHVILPKANLCCGRPLYDWGMLDRAKRLLLDILDALKDEIARDIPIVVLEPSCAAVFRDELLNLFPKDERARQIRAPRHRLLELVLAAFQQLLEVGPLMRCAAVATAATALVPRHETCLSSAARGVDAAASAQ
jgi:hypothetical protein